MPGPLRDSMLPSPRQQLVTHGRPPLQLALCTQPSCPVRAACCVSHSRKEVIKKS